ncbi:MAG: glycosyltransferase family 4 protein [Chloroflexota bacterium]
MAGPAIRYLELARVLADEFDVQLGHPATSGATPYGLVLATYERGRFDSIAQCVSWADVILVNGSLLSLFPQLATCGKPIVVDIYDTFVFENLEHHRYLPEYGQARALAGDLTALTTILQAGDFFICANERQRDFWLGMLAAHGRVNSRTYGADRSLRKLIDLVPFGISAEPPRRSVPVVKGVHPKIAALDRLLIWGGGLWDWLDPQTLVKALAQVRATRTDVKLLFMAQQPLTSAVQSGNRAGAESVALARDLGLLDECVFFGDWVPYAERGAYLLEADIGVSLHLDGAETHFAFRTRLLDYIWAGLPILATEGDSLGEMVAARSLGRVVPAGDADQVATAVLSLLAEKDLRERLARDFSQAAAPLVWEKAARPLQEFFRRPYVAADRQSGGLESVSAISGVPDRPGGISMRPTRGASLPAKAFRALRLGGVATLKWEIERYWRWKTLRWRQH